MAARLRSLLHGDLQPRNIRILQGDQVKVLDFGIAKALSLSRKVTRNDFGSIAYLSPERLDTGDIDAHADLWAVGVLLRTRWSAARGRSRPPTPAASSSRSWRVERRSRWTMTVPSDYRRLSPGRWPPIQPIDTPARRRCGTTCPVPPSGTETEAQRANWPARAVDEPSTRRTRRPDVVDEVVTKRSAPDRARTSRSSLLRSSPPILTPVRSDAVSRRRPEAPDEAVPKALCCRLLCWRQCSSSLPTRCRCRGRHGGLRPWRRHRNSTTPSPRGGRCDGLRSRSMRGGFAGLERALAQQTEVLAERVFSNYRTPQPTVREAQWKSARELIAEALAAKPGDSRLKAALRYCDGHLHRIKGEARLSKKLTAEANQEFAEAVTAFREAAELRSDWPDPFLGLLRTFIYGLEDVDRGADALKQAQRLGYQQSDREMAQLGDGYRARADTFARTARTLLGLPQEQDSPHARGGILPPRIGVLLERGRVRRRPTEYPDRATRAHPD